ncbi:MAG TPA: UDP-4-amino-4,6-dideoxy-N-acetyl-beta-L-altrosamine N-acetyltransferase [Caulobacteraceae bacterium]|jgi:UDP-4-amino-4,6-dideoxy-N-acetyl-beta-L-altrosamine N-acetyltransferase|nr:UDP-4-amino-4,6-dideoxy-N-acetyl-beta-L-altrosamine N-acetyltransferase [Caulobacteraceae bacterium]
MIELKDLGLDDGDRLYHWRRQPEVDRWMSHAPPHDLETHQAWLESFLADSDRKGWIVADDGRPCGFLMLKGVADPQQRAQWGWYIGEAEARGRGAGRAAQALGLERAFYDFALQKVWSEVLADNDAALKAQSAAGFRREGYLRRHVFKDGRFRDVALLAILAEEWKERRGPVLRDLQASGLIRKG